MAEYEFPDDQREAFATALGDFGARLEEDEDLQARVEIDSVAELRNAGLPDVAILDFLLRRDRVIIGDRVAGPEAFSICCRSCTTTICGGTVCGYTCKRSNN